MQTNLQQTVFLQNAVTKGKVAHNEPLLFMSQCFQFYFTICPKSSATYLLYVGMGLNVLGDNVEFSYLSAGLDTSESVHTQRPDPNIRVARHPERMI